MGEELLTVGAVYDRPRFRIPTSWAVIDRPYSSCPAAELGRDAAVEFALQLRRQLSPLMREVEHVNRTMALGGDQDHLDVASVRGNHRSRTVQESECILSHNFHDGTAL